MVKYYIIKIIVIITHINSSDKYECFVNSIQIKGPGRTIFVMFVVVKLNVFV